MADQISVTGLVGTEPKFSTTQNGLDVLSFRLASTHRKFDRETGNWIESDVNWYTVVCYRGLARHAAESIGKGERVLVHGNLKVRDWDNGERSGTSVEIDASSIGHDLLFGTSEFTRRSHSIQSAEDEESEQELEPELQPA